MLTTGSITTETFSAALLGLEDLSLRITAAALHVAANPEKHPRLRLMLADLSDVMQCCEVDLGLNDTVADKAGRTYLLSASARPASKQAKIAGC